MELRVIISILTVRARELLRHLIVALREDGVNSFDPESLSLSQE